jgi:ribosomal protein S18 acetylase RimI-like enzyme
MRTMPGSDESLEIRPTLTADITEVVAIHEESFSGFFLTFLGRAFLCELYTATLRDPTGLSFVAVDGNRLVGFVSGTSQPDGFYRRLLRHRWWRFALASASAVLRRPAIIPRLLRAFNVPEQVAEKAMRATLMSIAVRPETQGRGIGEALVKTFLSEAKARGATTVDLTTDRCDNEAVNRFYRKLGFTCERAYVTPEGRAMNEYVIDLA